MTKNKQIYTKENKHTKKNEEKTFLKKDYCWATDLGPSGLLEEIYHLYIIVLRFAR